MIISGDFSRSSTFFSLQAITLIFTPPSTMPSMSGQCSGVQTTL